MNIKYIEPRNTSRKHLKRLEDMFGLKQLIKEPTRITPRLNSTIELILTNTEHISNSGVLHLKISDHEAVFLNRKKNQERFVTTIINTRSYVNYDNTDKNETLKK